MPVSFVQQSATFTTTSATIAAGTSSNTLIFVIATENSPASFVTSLACTNVTWTRLSANSLGTLNNEIWLGKISGGASGTTVTITLTQPGALIAGSVSEFSGVMSTGVIDNGGPVSNTSTGTTVTTGDFITTADSNLLIVCEAHTSATPPSGQPAGYTSLTFDSNITIGVQTNYSTSNSSGTQSAGWTLTSTEPWISNGGGIRKAFNGTLINGAPGNIVGLAFFLTQGQPTWYGFQMLAAQGIPPYTVTAAGLPPGLVCQSSPEYVESINGPFGFKVTGTPTTLGDYHPVFTITDALGGVGTWDPTAHTGQPWTVQAHQGNTADTDGDTFFSLPPGTHGVPYSFTFDDTYAGALFRASGFALQPPYTYSIPSWSPLNPGMAVSSGGILTGTPNQSSYPTLELPFHYLTSLDITGNLGDSVSGQPVWFHVFGFQTQCAANSATVGTPYSSSEPAIGGTPPYTFSIVAGALPPGLTLDASTGVVSGTPTEDVGSYPITYSYTWRLTDSVGGTQNTNCAIVVAAGPPPPLNYRNTGAQGKGYRCHSNQPPMCAMKTAADRCLTANSKAFTRYVKSGNIWRRQFPKYASQVSPPWVKMPYDAIRLNSNGVLQFSSLTANVLTPIVTYTVPAGHYGIINQTLQVFAAQTGPQFQDGSTALKWYIGQNEAFASGFTGMNFHQGSLNSIGRVGYGAGIRMSPNQIYTYYVVSDGTPLDPEGRIICGFNGWIYPAHS